VPKYGEVPAATLASQALSVTTHYIWDVFKCSVHIPTSLATAVYHGQFRWPTMFTQGAFSIFSLPSASALGQLVFRSEEERVHLELEVTKGKGISAAQAVATAKIHHSPITGQ
jgi:metal-dependent HD superfamily phosphatase/phosphodiesterase